MTIEQVKVSIACLLIAAAVIFGGLTCLGGCGGSRAQTTPRQPITPVRVISVRCSETAEEVPNMRTWCNSTMVAPSQTREACRFVADYERRCL